MNIVREDDDMMFIEELTKLTESEDYANQNIFYQMVAVPYQLHKVKGKEEEKDD